MDLYSHDLDLIFFDAPYKAKQLLDDSLSRTFRGYGSIRAGELLNGSRDLLIGRVESAAACGLVALSSAFLALLSGFTTPIALIPAIALNIASRMPGVSSFQTAQDFIQGSNGVIYRIFRIHLIAIPTILLFLTASSVNTVLPGALGPQPVLLRAIEKLVGHLGQLKRVRATTFVHGSWIGSPSKLSPLKQGEEYCRALSPLNQLREVFPMSLTLHHTRIIVT